MKKFEYKVVDHNEVRQKYGDISDESYQSYFNDLGKEGWELIAINGNAGTYFFKREITISSYPISSTK